MTNEDKQRIEEEAENYAFQVPYDGSGGFYDESALKGYIAGATAELERSEKLLEEYREVIMKLVIAADYNDYDEIDLILNRAKSLIETTSKPEQQ